MNTKTYEYFEQLYRLRSFTKAAKAALISPQGLWKAIRSLEAELDVPLFDGSSGIQLPTCYGEIYHEFATRELASYAELRRAIDVQKSRMDFESIRLCSSTGVLGALDEPIERFEREYSGCRILLEDYPDFVCDSKLKEEACDLALTIFPYAPDFHTVQMYDGIHYCWVLVSDPLSTHSAIRLEDFRGRAVVSVGHEYKGCIELLRKLDEAGITLAEHRTWSEMVLIERQVHQGLIGLTVKHQAELFDFDEEVKAVPFPDLPWRFGISYLKTHELRPVERAFIHFMLTEVAVS
ncbi:LysR family transcriptional regulator [Slackia exigua]|uniref:LysR family transcriptional regulator n=1 Tax=Slackia exigua TaxID=84109 RepID=UPI0028D5D76B|nr:LysR family transcriptional regulator [Slackia exigua]